MEDRTQREGTKQVYPPLGPPVTKPLTLRKVEPVAKLTSCRKTVALTDAFEPMGLIFREFRALLREFFAIAGGGSETRKT
jgi:hypothetical protein